MANQRRTGGNQKITTPSYSEQGVIRASRVIENAYDLAVNTRLFQDASIPAVKVVGGGGGSGYWLGDMTNVLVVDPSGTAPDSYLTVSAALAASTGTKRIMLLGNISDSPTITDRNIQIFSPLPTYGFDGNTSFMPTITGVITVSSSSGANVQLSGLRIFGGVAASGAGSLTLTIHRCFVVAFSNTALSHTGSTGSLVVSESSINGSLQVALSSTVNTTVKDDSTVASSITSAPGATISNNSFTLRNSRFSTSGAGQAALHMSGAAPTGTIEFCEVVADTSIAPLTSANTWSNAGIHFCRFSFTIDGDITPIAGSTNAFV